MEISDLASATAQSASARASTSIAKTFDNFLILLTTQLKNQDPLEPLSSADFTAQLVQFTNVEQNIATNENLENMLRLTRAQLTASAAAYLGRIIEADGNTTQLVDGGAHWTYEVEGAPTAIVLTITDESGRLVHTSTGDTTPGEQNLVWDGNDRAGNALPAGTYRLTVTARDAESTELPARIGVVGRVDGVETADGETRLMIGEAAIPLTAIRRLSLDETAG